MYSMRKMLFTMALGTTMLLASCGTHTATGAYTGASLGGMIGSAVGSISGKSNGSAVGTIVGAAGGAAVGGAIGSAMDKKQNSGRSGPPPCPSRRDGEFMEKPSRERGGLFVGYCFLISMSRRTLSRIFFRYFFIPSASLLSMISSSSLSSVRICATFSEV